MSGTAKGLGATGPAGTKTGEPDQPLGRYPALAARRNAGAAIDRAPHARPMPRAASTASKDGPPRMGIWPVGAAAPKSPPAAGAAGANHHRRPARLSTRPASIGRGADSRRTATAFGRIFGGWCVHAAVSWPGRGDRAEDGLDAGGAEQTGLGPAGVCFGLLAAAGSRRPARAARRPASWLSLGVDQRRTARIALVPLERPTAWRLTALDGPPRLLLDLPNLPWRGPARQPGAGWSRRMERQGSGSAQQLVILLAAPGGGAAGRGFRRAAGGQPGAGPGRRIRPAGGWPQPGRRRGAARAAAAGGARPRPWRQGPRRDRRARDAGEAHHPGRGAGAEASAGGRRPLPGGADPVARRLHPARRPDRAGAAAGGGAVPVPARGQRARARAAPASTPCRRRRPTASPPPWRGGRTRPTAPAACGCRACRPRCSASCSA